MENERNGAPGPGGDPGANVDNRSRIPAPMPIKWKALVVVVATRKIDTAMWFTRLMTIIFSILYILPVLGSPRTFYFNALFANAVTSALRLRQRVPVLMFNIMLLSQIFLEDSCHYLFYSLIFMYSSQNPITLAILPIFLFAAMHFASFSLTLLDVLGRNYTWIALFFKHIIESQTVTILRIAAGAEIFTLPFTIIHTLIGRSSLATPFIYYRFLSVRYSSRRNHYTRDMFRDIRIYFESLSLSPRCPAVFAKFINKFISIVSCLGPKIPPSAK